MRDQFVILIGTAVHIPFTAGMTRRAAGPPPPAGAAGRTPASRPRPAATPGLALEKYPVASNYPAEHLFTTNTYML
jgi:hypothetical protein